MGKLKIPSVQDLAEIAKEKPAKRWRLVKGPRETIVASSGVPVPELVVLAVVADPLAASLPSAARMRAYDQELTLTSSSPDEASVRQLVILTELSIFGDPISQVYGSRVFLLPDDLSLLQEMGSR